MGLFGGASDQDVNQPAPGGYGYLNDGRGEQTGAWGGRSASMRNTYQGGWSGPAGYDEDGNYHIPDPTDKEAYDNSWEFTKSGRQEDVDRYRSIADTYANRAAPTVDYGRADAEFGKADYAFGGAERALADASGDRWNAANARGSQEDALALQRSAARGEAPSRAELLGKGLISQSLHAQQAGAASARGGPLAQMAAQRQVRQGAAQFQQQGLNQLSALRADEMERARQQYQAGATGIRGQDYVGAQGANQIAGTWAGMAGQHAGIAGQHAAIGQYDADLEMRNRALSDEGRFNYEKLGWDTNNAAANLEQGYAGMAQQNYQFGRQEKQQEADRDQRTTAAAIGGVASGTGAYLDYAGRTQGQKPDPTKTSTSDMRAKVPLMLDLGGAKPKAASPNWLASHVEKERQSEALRNEHKARMSDVDFEADDYGIPDHRDAEEKPDFEADDYTAELPGGREDPYSHTPGGVQREDPYGSGQYFFSDEKAKQAAYLAGASGEPMPKASEPKKLSSSEALARGANVDAYISEPVQRKGPHPDVAEGRERAASSSALSRGANVDAYISEPKPRSMQSFERGTGAPGGHPDAAEGRERASNAQYEREMQGQPGRLPGANQPAEKPKAPMPQSAAPKKGNPLTQLQEDANRRGAGLAYAYKDEYRPPEQAPGEVNYGFSAQELEKNPLTATAVKKDPDGMRFVDTTKLLKTNTAGIASLQEQIDELKGGYRYG